MSTSSDLLLLQRYFDYPIKVALKGGLSQIGIGASAMKLAEKISKSILAKRDGAKKKEEKPGDHVLVDVREQKAQDGEIVGAKRVSFNRFLADPKSEFQDKDAHYVLCCDTGMRSKVACMALRNCGFNNVHYMVLRGNPIQAEQETSVSSDELRYHLDKMGSGPMSSVWPHAATAAMASSM